jgi:uncharacterized membrane protein
MFSSWLLFMSLILSTPKSLAYRLDASKKGQLTKENLRVILYHCIIVSIFMMKERGLAYVRFKIFSQSDHVSS